jgi:hypothetical protein
MKPKALNVIPQENYILLIEFDNGETGFFDVKPYLKYKAFEKLSNLDEFKKVKVSGLSIEWESGADICPDELYNLSEKIN